MINIDGLTLGQIKEIQALSSSTVKPAKPHPFVGRRALIRTFSAGVHIGDVQSVDETGMQVHLTNALRLWKWEGGGLSLSSVASNGIKGGRLNRTSEVYLTNAIEFIPTTPGAEKTYAKFIEDEPSRD